MRTLDPEIGARVTEAVQALGIETRLSEEMTALQTTGGTGPTVSADGSARRVTAVVTTGGVIPADVVVLGLGARPNSSLGRAAGLQLGHRGSVKVDRAQRTSADGVWAAGDCAETFNLVSRTADWVPLATVANKTGRAAGQNIAGGNLAFPGCLGTAITKIGETEIARTGLLVRDLEQLGIDYAAVQIDAMTRSHYYPGKQPITIRLLGEKGCGRLLGGQIVGGPGAGKRIDTVATALQAGLAAEQMLDLDLAYAPPFAPVWEPMLIAVRELVKNL
jgi:NADPH-dependent 2,4-dienoyl-CoA reductase/sulfur reductase-like enzyme